MFLNWGFFNMGEVVQQYSLRPGNSSRSFQTFSFVYGLAVYCQDFSSDWCWYL